MVIAPSIPRKIGEDFNNMLMLETGFDWVFYNGLNIKILFARIDKSGLGHENSFDFRLLKSFLAAFKQILLFFSSLLNVFFSLSESFGFFIILESLDDFSTVSFRHY